MLNVRLFDIRTRIRGFHLSMTTQVAGRPSISRCSLSATPHLVYFHFVTHNFQGSFSQLTFELCFSYFTAPDLSICYPSIVEHEFVQNYKVLQAVFNQEGIDKVTFTSFLTFPLWICLDQQVSSFLLITRLHIAHYRSSIFCLAFSYSMWMFLDWCVPSSKIISSGCNG